MPAPTTITFLLGISERLVYPAAKSLRPWPLLGETPLAGAGIEVPIAAHFSPLVRGCSVQLPRDVHVVAAERCIGSQGECVLQWIEDLGSIESISASIFAAGDQHLAVRKYCSRMIESRAMHRADRRERIRRKIEHLCTR